MTGPPSSAVVARSAAGGRGAFLRTIRYAERVSPRASGERRRVAFVTCSKWPESSPDDQWALRGLRERGLAADPVVWDGDVEWSVFDLVVLRSPWDYFERGDEFLQWLERVERTAPVWNPPGMVRWNAHKGYLLELERRGVPIVPTEVIPRGTRDRLAAIAQRRGWGSVVVKPAVGGNAYRLRAFADARTEEAQSHLDALSRSGDVLVQPLLPGPEELGERSLVFIDGAFSHAVAYRSVLRENPRRPRAVRPTPDELAIASRVLDGLAPPPLYARLDFLPAPGDRWVLGELEVFEPELFFASDPASVGRFAEAVVSRLAHDR